MEYITDMGFSEKKNSFYVQLSLIYIFEDMERGETLGDHSIVLDSASAMLPIKRNGERLKFERDRFRTSIGPYYKREGKRYVGVNLFYDAGELDVPTDDIFLASIPFEVRSSLVDRHVEDREDLEYEAFPYDKDL